MKERPILFSAEMVKSILAGRKTMTRRVVKLNSSGRVQLHGKQWHIEDKNVINGCPFGVPGDRLWVRETWGVEKDFNNIKPFELWPGDDESMLAVDYAADKKRIWHRDYQGKWRPSIHMPRWASRITLEITSVRVERLQKITNNDALAEGTPDLRTIKNNWDMKHCFSHLWDSINGKKHPWTSNPWVWVIEFRRSEN